MRWIPKFNCCARRRRCRRACESGLMRRPRLYLSLFVAAAVAAGAAHRAGAQRRGMRSSEYRSRIDTTLAFDRNGTVTVTAGNGDIIVTGTQATAVHVRATSDDDNLRIDASAARMSVEVTNRHG